MSIEKIYKVCIEYGYPREKEDGSPWYDFAEFDNELLDLGGIHGNAEIVAMSAASFPRVEVECELRETAESLQKILIEKIEDMKGTINP